MKYYRKLVGEHIYLSPINSDEVDSYLKWMNDEEVAVNFGQYPCMVSSKSDLEWIYEPSKDMQRYAIVHSDNDLLLGSISLHNIDHLNRNAYIGIFIGDMEHRSKGRCFLLMESMWIRFTWLFWKMNLTSNDHTK